MLRSFALAALLGSFCLSCQSTTPITTSTPAVTSRPPAPTASLFETRWVLRQAGQQVVSVPQDGQEPYLLLRRTGAVDGAGSCNRFRGTATTDSTKSLIFSPLLSTRMACPAMTTEQEFMQALAATHSYRISGDTLLLYSTNAPSDAQLARLEAVHLR